jgi:hypothetical protein
MATITHRGSAWRVQIRRGDHRLNRTFDTETQAREWAATADVRSNTAAPSSAVPVALSSRTVADLFDRYAREVSPQKRGERWAIRLLKLGPSFQMLAMGLTKEAVAQWRDQRLKEVSPWPNYVQPTARSPRS